MFASFLLPPLRFVVPQLFAGVCVGALFTAVIVDFLLINHRKDVRRIHKSIVATGSMTVFFAVYYVILVNGKTSFDSGSGNVTFLWFGSILVFFGAFINIWGRLLLKNNWANHIKIYEDHVFIKTGVYRVVRHPLYASLMLMLFGGSLMYGSILDAALTAFLFIPFMAYRAKQEEAVLDTVFPEYALYKKQTGMFFPKLWR